MPIPIKDSKKLAKAYSKALILEEGNKVSIAHSSTLKTYLVVIEKGREVDYIDPFSLEIVSSRDLGELVEELVRVG